MGPISMLFGNPAMKILEERLWAGARQRYLEDHPADRQKSARTIMRKAKTQYKDKIEVSLKEADQQMKAKWGQFKHGMTEELRAALTTLFRMSDLDWYSVEVGSPACPDVIAVPYELLKHLTESLTFQHLRKGIDFENLNDETLKALATYAADQKFPEVLEGARSNYQPFEIGRSSRFVISEIIRGDSYFLGEEEHHSRIDTVILSSLGASLTGEDKKKNHKSAVKKWFHEYRETRRNDRRFTGDGWEIGLEELKSWVCGS
jgi:hypothetical protein